MCSEALHIWEAKRAKKALISFPIRVIYCPKLGQYLSQIVEQTGRRFKDSSEVGKYLLLLRTCEFLSSSMLRPLNLGNTSFVKGYASNNSRNMFAPIWKKWGK